VAVLLALRRTGQLTTDDLTALFKGASLLHLAAATGQVTTLKWLLDEAVIDVNDQTEGERLSALHCAVIGGDAAVVKAVLSARADTTLRHAPH
jgi:Ankyrin repeats (many copies)